MMFTERQKQVSGLFKFVGFFVWLVSCVFVCLFVLVQIFVCFLLSSPWEMQESC